MAFSFFLFLTFILAFSIRINPNAALGSATEFIGEWRVLSPSVGVSAMHMQLLPNSNQLLIFDRMDAGPSNLSLPLGHPCHNDRYSERGAIKKDCTAHSLLFDPTSASVRPLNIQTDTWCSSGALLPDATLIQMGGFSAGDRTVRTFDSSKTTTDWVEHPNYLSARRWYATAQVLPQGSVIIIGGRRQFNYEYYPKPADQNLFDFPFLKETSDVAEEDNLYPFVHLLPDGNLFIFANTRSVVLNPTSNKVVRELPGIPDRVPRNYPSTGSSVMLPLRPELARSKNDASTTPAEVLICGGAPYGNFLAANQSRFLPVANNCGRIRVTDSRPVWRMENMPMPRVMGDMVLLPTGDVLIVNGASSGSAGWNSAKDPVTAPVLYRPSAKKLDERFAVLKSTLTPRMYHSTAVLDNFGRVIVGGSNPHFKYEFYNTTYPTDLSIEAFYPPYLEARLNPVKPKITDDEDNASVGHGSTMRVRFSCGVDDLQKGTGHKNDLEVVLVAPAFATHSLGMNQRMVVLTVDRVDQVGPLNYEATVSAPPTPEIAPPGYYMMFVVRLGVPSDAVWVRLVKSQ